MTVQGDQDTSLCQETPCRAWEVGAGEPAQPRPELCIPELFLPGLHFLKINLIYLVLATLGLHGGMGFLSLRRVGPLFSLYGWLTWLALLMSTALG